MVMRVLLLPVRLAYGAGKAGVRTGFRAGRLSVGSTYRVGRFVGLTRLLALGLGVVVGLLFAPGPGRETRASLQRRLAARREPAGDEAVAERVRHELSHSPRTWHLPQPTVDVVGGVAVLTGDAPHETGKSDIERAVASVPGVAEVDSRLVVAGPGDGDATA
ncbi:MAG TPA: BON domain-containing protein [Acidimicrobiales bacterium]|nr:BON domain-containing protein [Acidimicrobiales bacterium]